MTGRKSNIWNLRIDPDNTERMILKLAERHSHKGWLKRLFSKSPVVEMYRLTTYIAYSRPDDTYVWRAVPVDRTGKVTGPSMMFCSGGLPSVFGPSVILETDLPLSEIQLQWLPDSERHTFSEDTLLR